MGSIKRVSGGGTLIHAITHHAKDKELVASTMAMLLLPLWEDGWAFKAMRGSTNSFRLMSPDRCRQFHFRNGGPGVVKVYTSFWYRSLGQAPVATLVTRMDCIRFVATLVP